MSLVAYAASTDDESENEEETPVIQVQLLKPTSNASASSIPKKLAEKAKGGHISDEDDDYVPQEVSLHELRPPTGRLTLNLPKPKLAEAPTETELDKSDQVTQAFAKLPMPRAAARGAAVIEELDDEFLHKKAAGSAQLEKPPLPTAAKGRVKISIPSLKEFADVDKEKAEKLQGKQATQVQPKKGSSLLSILPQAKSERDFAKKSEPVAANPVHNVAPATKSASNASKVTGKPSFVPDTVKLRRAAHNTEGVDGLKAPPGKQPKTPKSKAALVSVSDSEDDEDDDMAGDFFSLHKEQQLPEVSSNEINALVAKRAAKMAEATSKYLAAESERAVAEQADAQADHLRAEALREAQKRYHEQHLDTEAMDALVGKNAKRRRKVAQEVQVIDISDAQVLPDRSEWLRSALASTTSFQATGVLTDEEPVAGTRRKHQITYLAHKAKANEAELQAMWSANRQTRRATQSKYGF